MNKEQTQDNSLIKTLNSFLVLFIIYILIALCIFHFALQEADEAIAKAPQNEKAQVFASRMLLYSYIF